MQPGDRLIWYHTPRGGYGYTLGVPSRFVAWGKFDRVRIDVQKKDGEVVGRTVCDANLVRAEDRVPLTALRRAAVHA